MLLAGDVGGTKTLLGLFERFPRRPSLIASHAYRTNDFPSFTAILDAFEADSHRERAIDAAAIGVAGPVIDQRARLPHIVWDVSAEEIRTRCGTDRVELINDLEALAHSVHTLDE